VDELKPGVDMCTLQVALSLTLLAQAADKKASAELLQQRANATRVSLVKAERKPLDKESIKLVEKPIFRYSDELRAIEDGGIWLWTSDSRPVAALKVERYKQGRLRVPWLYCFASLSSELVCAEWDDAAPFQARKPGIMWQSLDDKPATTRGSRLLQMRELARRFSAELIKGAEEKERTQMRLLTQPLYRCAESAEVLDGAIFGFTGTGTNPDLLLLLELSSEGPWRYAAAGMTAEGLRIKLNDRVVFESPNTAGKGTVFDTWCHFHPSK
jgi:hypothetical protein